MLGGVFLDVVHPVLGRNPRGPVGDAHNGAVRGGRVGPCFNTFAICQKLRHGPFPPAATFKY
jgi:hypothetical protein